MSQVQYQLIAKDFSRLLRQVQLEGGAGNLEQFQSVWEKGQYERMFFAGTVLPQGSTQRHVCAKLLSVAAAFLSFPPSISELSQPFGLMLLYQLWFTQPFVEKEPIVVDSSSIEVLLETVQGSEELTAVLKTLHVSQAFKIVPFVDNKQSVAAATFVLQRCKCIEKVGDKPKITLQPTEAEKNYLEERSKLLGNIG